MTKDKLRVRDSERFKSLVSLHLVKKKSGSIAAVKEKEMLDSLSIFSLSVCVFGCLSACLSMCMFVSTSVLLSASLRIFVFLQTHKSVCSRKDCKLNI